MRIPITRVTMATLAAVISVLTLGTTNATANPTPEKPAGMVETLKANPGSVRTGENTVMLKTGFMVGFPNDQVGAEAVNPCPEGWACFWLNSNFDGTWGGIRQGAHVWLRDYWYLPGTGHVEFSPGVRPGPGYVTFDRKVSSVFNNTGVTAGFRAYFNIDYQRYNPWTLLPYVGNLLNDSFDKACICNP